MGPNPPARKRDWRGPITRHLLSSIESGSRCTPQRASMRPASGHAEERKSAHRGQGCRAEERGLHSPQDRWAHQNAPRFPVTELHPYQPVRPRFQECTPVCPAAEPVVCCGPTGRRPPSCLPNARGRLPRVLARQTALLISSEMLPNGGSPPEYHAATNCRARPHRRASD
jgi:hypothetical protein